MNESARPRALLLSAAAVVLLCAPSRAQEQPSAAREPTQRETESTLQSRNRNRMHPGDPLVIVGLEEGDNDIRSRTPALANSDRVSAQVDTDEAYARALAMYESRATFTTPLALSPEMRLAAAAERSKASAAKRPASEPVQGGPQWPWLVALGVTIGFIAWLGRRFGGSSADEPRAS